MIVKNKKIMMNLFRKMSIVYVAVIAVCLYSCKSAQKSADVDRIYFENVDEYPLFDGKPVEDVFRKYIGRNTCYPVEAHVNGIFGCVFVEFIIEKDGSVSNVKVVGGTDADPILQDEALRVIKGSPKWTPGKKDGKTVRVSYTLPIVYRFPGQNVTSSSKKAKLSKKTILLEELIIEVYG